MTMLAVWSLCVIGAVASLSSWEAEINARCKAEGFESERASRVMIDEMDGFLCYNVPYFDTSNGTFAIDLRLYRRSNAQPPSCLMSAMLEYEDAVVEDQLLPQSTVRLATVAVEYMISAAEVKCMHVWRFVARLNRDRLMEEDLQPFLLPTVHLHVEKGEDAVNISRTSDQMVRFVVGNFALWEVRKEPPFVIPGRHIETFPTGWIIYSVHLVIMLAVLARGTLLRRMDRKHSEAVHYDKNLSFLQKHTASVEEGSKEQEFHETGVAM